jgi:gamma-glutamyltranspeptidase / glutathione hydrolase
VIEARRFPHACVASPHHLASAAGLAVLASGGNAMDASVATNLVLGVVTPYLCGYGGDLFALIWSRDGIAAYNGSGRAPGAATREAMRTAARGDTLPIRGPLTVTVPGAVDGWFALLERFGTRPFRDLAEPALALARDGFPLSEAAEARLEASRELFAEGGQFDAWRSVYGGPGVRPGGGPGAGGVLRQPWLARTIEALAEGGREAFYQGPIARAIGAHLRSLGGLMSADDLGEHRGEWIYPIRAPYRDVEILELPPNTQGVAVLEALRILESLGPLPEDGPHRQHRLIEVVKMALSDRTAYVTDPRDMDGPAEALLDSGWIEARARAFDPAGASRPAPGRPGAGGTAYLCAADGDGMLVSLIQSNWQGFGSGVTVPEWGINLHNRGTYFSLKPGHPNVIAPGKRTLHTLIPAMALRHGRPWLVFGSMGGDGQAQTHVQLLAHIVDDGQDIQRAVSAPRWVVSPADWSVTAESRFGSGLIEALRALGHRVANTGPFDSLMGHANVIRVTEHGFAGASDPRSEGAVLGL